VDLVVEEEAVVGEVFRIGASEVPEDFHRGETISVVEALRVDLVEIAAKVVPDQEEIMTTSSRGKTIINQEERVTRIVARVKEESDLDVRQVLIVLVVPIRIEAQEIKIVVNLKTEGPEDPEKTTSINKKKSKKGCLQIRRQPFFIYMVRYYLSVN
jgi:hypothetical protein